MNNNNILKVGTDFSGIGAPEQALTNLGINYKSVFACEIDKFARKSYEAIHPKPETFYNDITERNHAEVEQLDLYVAGFPCQAFSIAGSRKGFDDVRGTLFFNVADFIRINQPKCFVLENVKGLLSHNNGATFQTIVSLLSDNGGTANGQVSIPYFEDGLGYHIYYKVLNTKHYGIPQNRERIFIVGFKEFREFRFPKPFPLELRLKDMLQDNAEYKYFLNDKQLNYLKNSKHEHSVRINNIDDISPTICAKSGGGHEPYISVGNKHLITDKKIKVKSATKKGYEEAGDGDSINFSVPNSKTRRGRVGKGVAQTLDTAFNQAVVKQLNPSKESGGVQPYQQNRLYDIDGISPALNTIWNGGNMINTYRIRRLTPLECWRLQSFPDEQLFKAQAVNSDTQLYKQAGNSITVRVIQKIISKIYEAV